MKVREHLKRLPRDVRNDVIKKEFSQKQRLILEEWMVSLSVPAQLEAQAVAESPGVSVALVATEADQLTAVNSGRAANKKRCGRRPKAKDRTRLSSSGSVYKVNVENQYRACIRFDALDIHSGCGELQTALEYLVILTAVKQKMLDCTGSKHSGAPFEDRLRDALISSAAEHGRNYADLGLRFAVVQPAGFLVAQGFQVRSPSVRSFSDLGKLRRGLRPFRKYAWKWGRSSIYWWYSPMQLEEAWQSFQKAVADAWEIGGVDSTRYMSKIRSLRMANTDARNRHLQQWESKRMAVQDKNRHRPKRLRSPLRFRSQIWERERMRREDRKIHQRTRRAYGKNPDDVLAADVSVLRKLLRKWDRMLKSEAQLADKARRKILQQRKRQRNEKRQQEVLKRREIRKQQQQERFRRDTLWKRMRSDQTMDNLAWI
eukprot:Skav223178  [mRNA]  locus=scaffold2044:175545:176831:+ [translate_table: standard]